MEEIATLRQLPTLRLHHQGASQGVVVGTVPDPGTADDHHKMEGIATARQLFALHLHHQSWSVAVETSPDPGTVAVLLMMEPIVVVDVISETVWPRIVLYFFKVSFSLLQD